MSESYVLLRTCSQGFSPNAAKHITLTMTTYS